MYMVKKNQKNKKNQYNNINLRKESTMSINTIIDIQVD